MANLFFRGIPLVAFLLAVVFPAWAQDSKGVGVVTALKGQADLKRPEAPQVQALKLRDNLYVRDVVDTQRESLARILLMGKSTVTVWELSRFEIREEALPDGALRAIINLAAGKIRVMVARRLMRPGDEVQIRTPNAIAAVRGSDGIFEVSTLPDGTPHTQVFVLSGEFGVTVPSTEPTTAMAEVASDAPPGIPVARSPVYQSQVYVIGALNGLRVGPAVSPFRFSTQDAISRAADYLGDSVRWTGTSTAHTSDRAAAAGIAGTFTTRSGATVLAPSLVQTAGDLRSIIRRPEILPVRPGPAIAPGDVPKVPDQPVIAAPSK